MLPDLTTSHPASPAATDSAALLKVCSRQRCATCSGKASRLGSAASAAARCRLPRWEGWRWWSSSQESRLSGGREEDAASACRAQACTAVATSRATYADAQCPALPCPSNTPTRVADRPGAGCTASTIYASWLWGLGTPFCRPRALTTATPALWGLFPAQSAGCGARLGAALTAWPAVEAHAGARMRRGAACLHRAPIVLLLKAPCTGAINDL